MRTTRRLAFIIFAALAAPFAVVPIASADQGINADERICAGLSCVEAAYNRGNAFVHKVEAGIDNTCTARLGQYRARVTGTLADRSAYNRYSSAFSLDAQLQRDLCASGQMPTIRYQPKRTFMAHSQLCVNIAYRKNEHRRWRFVGQSCMPLIVGPR